VRLGIFFHINRDGVEVFKNLNISVFGIEIVIFVFAYRRLGVIAEDIASGKKLCYEVSDEYKFWIIWNDRGFNGYFCPEPMSAMIDAPNLDLPAGVSGYQELAQNESVTFKQRFFTVQ
jgi:galactose mutarotase-like enzyme